MLKCSHIYVIVVDAGSLFFVCKSAAVQSLVVRYQPSDEFRSFELHMHMGITPDNLSTSLPQNNITNTDADIFDSRWMSECHM